MQRAVRRIPGLLLFKMLLAGIWNGGLSDESVEDMANSNLHVMRFLGLSIEDDVPDHSVLSRFRTRLTAACAWDGLLTQMNEQIQMHDIMVRKGNHVDASITQSPRKPKTRPAYEVVSDREERDDEADARTAMQVIEVTQPGVDSEARWVRKGGKPVFGYKQQTVVDDNGLVLAVETRRPIAMTASRCWIYSTKPISSREPVFTPTRRIAAGNIALR
ncbi:transposase [Nitrosomonas ureae]|uniref:Transposase, IS5 family n=1 Tax=Nitrosomonas ureae TaxID=44577 RepID=A0A1H5WSN5_9PROT|nr:transposase [Nitrosomonas ureae]SEG02502.1 transposase, IS5 family [Nitrosomonas ureae]